MKKETGIPEFGIKRDNEERRDGGCGVIFDPVSQKYAVAKKTENEDLLLFAGGVADDEDTKDGVLREIREESGLHDFLYVEEIVQAMCHFHNALKNVNRLAHATCFLVILKSTDTLPTKLEEHEKFALSWASAEEILANWGKREPERYPEHWDYFLKKSVKRAQELGYDKISKL